jgi:hypothetical protein
LDLHHQYSVDIRGPEEEPGSQGIYADISLHAGLILSNLQADGDLTNQVLQVTLLRSGAVELSRYEMRDIDADPEEEARYAPRGK